MARRVGLAGYGLAGAVFHAPLIEATPGLELARVMRSRDPLDLDLDLLVVATPNRTHVPLARAALEAGVPVVVDKPLAATAAEGRELAELAEERGLLLTVFQNRRWDADFLTLRRLLGEGALGEVLRFESRFERWRPEIKEGWRELADPAEAGGVLFDLGSHLVDQALVLFGPVDDVYAEVAARRAGARAADDAFLALTHRSGVVSHLWASQTAAHNGPRFRVLGSRAAYVKHGLDPQEAALREGVRPDEPDFGREPPEAWGVLGSGEDFRPVESEAGDYLAFYSAVEAALREGGPPPVPASEAVAVLEVLEAAGAG